MGTFTGGHAYNVTSVSFGIETADAEIPTPTPGGTRPRPQRRQHRRLTLSPGLNR